MAEKDWKHYLLKSGLPFEYEVKECFAKNNCQVWDEYSYLKPDENNLEKEFSYDIDVNYWDLSGDNSFTFLVECKYKSEPTKWFFMPDPYCFQSELSQNSFLHPIDHFSGKKFLFNKHPYYSIQEPLGPFCLKGIEIYQNQYLELNIFKAINQLSFAFVEQVISSIQNQIEVENFYETTFFNIPIIVTNAELYRINENVTTDQIEKAENIDTISAKQDFLLFHNKIGESLRRHNFSSLSNYFITIDEETLKGRNKSFTEDINHFIDVISRHYCPEIILIMHHDKEHKNYIKLFDYINFLIKPSDEREKAMQKVKSEWRRKMKEF
ncbi:MAG: hypothetical protein BGP13_19240 [Sphingobacteriales bacterium 40-81]|nr:MAG: hypothetical protein BGP13_19240 [Sphingobacteriales bacterium 40-81]